MDEDDLVGLASLVLENYFEFDGKVYWQNLGAAIGTKFAPVVAHMFMTVLERKMLAESSLKPWMWWIFLDDVFFIRTYGKEKLLQFFDYINSYYQTIKYTRNGR